MSGKDEKLQALARGVRGCTRCPLHENRTHAVPGEGPVDAPLFVIGEAPGRKEDEQGRPFTGAAGRYLDDLLEESGLSRKGMFITSCVKCRPPGNRNPRRSEVAVCCENWLYRQMDLVSPRLFVLFGAVAASTFIDSALPMKDMHGKVYDIDGRRFFVTYHPAAGMRFPVPDRAMREDFANLRQVVS